jgi:hypothetical protein
MDAEHGAIERLQKDIDNRFESARPTEERGN